MLLPVKKKSILIMFIFFLLGCTTIAPYNQRAFEQATTLKVEALSLVSKSNESYNKHKDDIEEFKLKMLKAYEYVNAIPKNSETSRQWVILTAIEGKSMFGFLGFWKEKDTLSQVFAEEYKKEIEKHFNKIIELEAGKIGIKD